MARTFYGLVEDGRRIAKTITQQVDDEPHPGWGPLHEATTQRERLLLMQPHRLLFDAESKTLREKPVIRLVASKMRVIANGQDEIEISAPGIPEDEQLDVRVAGQKGKVRAGDKIKVRADSQQEGLSIVVKASHPYFIIEPLVVMAVTDPGPPARGGNP